MRHKRKRAEPWEGSDPRKIDQATTPIKHLSNQSSHSLQPPVAIARPFGVVHAVFVRHLGTISRIGLYPDPGSAEIAAEMLNQVFSEETA